MDQTRTTETNKSDGQISVWMGLNISAWIRALRAYHFRIHARKIPLALFITASTLLQSLMGCIEGLIYGSKIKKTTIQEPPIFILGHWRSGTTLLHELLGLDTRHTCPTNFQCFCPNNFLLTEKLYKPLVNRMAPKQRPQDNMAVELDLPQEDECALNAMGISLTYLHPAFPNNPRILSEAYDPELLPARKLRKWESTFLYFLKKITFSRPGRLILKSPPHTFRIKTLLRLFPDAYFIHIVRNPYRVFQSTMNLWQSAARQYSLQDGKYNGLEEHVFALYDRMHAAFDENRSLIPPERFIELHYEELVKDPVRALQDVYTRFNLGEFETALPSIQKYLSDRTGYKTNTYPRDHELENKVYKRLHRIIDTYGYNPPSSPTADGKESVS